MYCPIHNPSGGVYDPNKVQFKKLRHAITNEYDSGGSVTVISTEKVPVVPKPFVPPASLPDDAPSVVQLDNTKMITSDYAAITMQFGKEPLRTYIFNVKLLPSNSPARQIVTALLYVTEGRLYNRYDTWMKQRRSGTSWATAKAYGSVDVVRCYDNGSKHTPPSPGPIVGESMWEETEGQPVTNEFAYLTGFKDVPILQTPERPFNYVLEQVITTAQEQNLSAEEKEALLQTRINDIQSQYVHDSRNVTDAPLDFDMVIHPLDLVGAPLYWVGGNTTDDAFVNTGNTSDLREWFMGHEVMHIPNKQMFADLGFRFAEFDIDGTIHIRSNCAFDKTPINEEKLFQEAQSNNNVRYTVW